MDAMELWSGTRSRATADATVLSGQGHRCLATVAIKADKDTG